MPVLLEHVAGYIVVLLASAGPNESSGEEILLVELAKLVQVYWKSRTPVE